MILILCTGNATRSVIAGAVLAAHLPDVEVVTSGTLSIDGLPMSWRTRAGFEAVGVTPPAHRSRQVQPADLDRATLVIGLAPEHVEWVRREHPSAAPRTATLKRLAQVTCPPTARPLAERVAAARPGRGAAGPVGGGRGPGRRRGRGVHRLRPGGRRPRRRRRRPPAASQQASNGAAPERRGGCRWPTISTPSWCRSRKCCSPPPGCSRARRWSTSAAEQARRRGEPPSSPAPPAASSASTWRRR